MISFWMPSSVWLTWCVKPMWLGGGAQDDEVWHLVNARLCDDDIGCGHLLGVCQGVVECLGNRLA